jgi:hypothetical protein
MATGTEDGGARGRRGKRRYRLTARPVVAARHGRLERWRSVGEAVGAAR